MNLIHSISSATYGSSLAIPLIGTLLLKHLFFVKCTDLLCKTCIHAVPSYFGINEPNSYYYPPNMTRYARELTFRTKTTPLTIIVAIIYAQRFANVLPRSAKGNLDTSLRILTASLIIASKYLHDCCYKNRHWAVISKDFSLEAINSMELEFLNFLSFEIAVNEKSINSFISKNFRIFNAVHDDGIVKMASATSQKCSLCQNCKGAHLYSHKYCKANFAIQAILPKTVSVASVATYQRKNPLFPVSK